MKRQWETNSNELLYTLTKRMFDPLREWHMSSGVYLSLNTELITSYSQAMWQELEALRYDLKEPDGVI